MNTLIIPIVCILAIGVPALIIAIKYNKSKEETYQMRQNHTAEIQRLENQIATTNIQQSYVETEAQRLYQEQIDLKLDAIDAGRAMIREALRHRN
ncbi:MAG: hypothetical protein ACK5MU_04270 [Candidatus Saccharimonadales bacterium]